MDHDIVKALLIEDNHGDARLIREMLVDSQSQNIQLVRVERLSQGIERIAQEKVDLTILDLSLPDAHGMECFMEFRRHAPQLPVIVLSGSDDEQLAMQAVQNGAQDYLVKGKVDGKSLVRAVRYALERHRMLIEIENLHKNERYLAYHDMLTGLPNRQLFHERLRQAIVHSKRNTKMLAVLFIDLDGFKSVNDTLGHRAGDLLLKSVADKLRKAVRENDTVARLGGDEFTIKLADIVQPRDATKVAEKILRLFFEPFNIEGKELFITASIGISMYPNHGHDAEMLVKNADLAMYRAKQQGKNKCTLYDLSFHALDNDRFAQKSSLMKALEAGELIAHYQPQVNLNTGKICGVEALVRWQHPEMGYLPPERFIPLAEETGLIVPLGEWMLRTACEQTKSWQETGYQPGKMAVNISARQFRNNGLAETVSKTLKEASLPADQLVLEITETCAMEDVDYTKKSLQELKNLGVSIALDDFGTGYSSLNYLKRFPVDKLKIDRSFIKGIPTNANDRAITSAIIALAHCLQLEVIAEGVESEEQLSFLRSEKCDEIQGYHFSQPLPDRGLAKLFESGKHLNGKKAGKPAPATPQN